LARKQVANIDLGTPLDAFGDVSLIAEPEVDGVLGGAVVAIVDVIAIEGGVELIADDLLVLPAVAHADIAALEHPFLECVVGGGVEAPRTQLGNRAVVEGEFEFVVRDDVVVELVANVAAGASPQRAVPTAPHAHVSQATLVVGPALPDPVGGGLADVETA